MERLEPLEDLSGYGIVVVQDFEFEEGELGRDFADRLASALQESGLFEEVLRENGVEGAIVVSGVIRHYDPGNIALRMKAGRGAGEGRLAGFIRLDSADTGERLGEIPFNESTLYFGPDASRTGRETGDWLQGQVIDAIVDTLREAREPG